MFFIFKTPNFHVCHNEKFPRQYSINGGIATNTFLIDENLHYKLCIIYTCINIYLNISYLRTTHSHSFWLVF